MKNTSLNSEKNPLQTKIKQSIFYYVTFIIITSLGVLKEISNAVSETGVFKFLPVNFSLECI